MIRDDIDAELPWGYWLRVQSSNGQPTFVDDETGAAWRSVRSAFWHGRLGMPDNGREPPPEHLELMHAMLAARARRASISDKEECGDVFQGSSVFRSFYLKWLIAAGLIGGGGNPLGETSLTAEGWSVLAMLHATRPYATRQSRPSGMTVLQLTELGLGPEERHARLARVEAVATSWEAAFLRQQDAGRPSVILSLRGKGPVPVKQTVWALAFETEEQRDSFYEWLSFRMDRWPAWAEFASEYGSRELTHKLLSVMASALEPHQPQAPPLMKEKS
jgi:hypothetical protein